MTHVTFPRRALVLLACAIALTSALAAPAESSAAGRITGGAKVDGSEYDARWQAIVSIGEATEGEAVLGPDRLGWLYRHECGGVLVRPDIVVTAAHCVDGEMWRRSVGGRLRILAGSRRLMRSAAKQRGQMVDVVGVRVHPSWTGPSGYFDESVPEGFDIAVLRLEQPIVGVQPMAIIGAGESALWGGGAGLREGAYVAGWGITNAVFRQSGEFGGVQSELREVMLPLLSDATCERTDLVMGGDAEGFDRATMLCGFGRDTDTRPDRSNRRGACHGDSGGPLEVVGPDSAPRLIGIVSWGPSSHGGCQSASVFTRVDGTRDWIESAIADLGATSNLVAPTPSSGTVIGSSDIRLRWPAGTGTPVRYTVLREAPVFSAGELDEIVSESSDEGEPIRPAVIRWLRSRRVLIPVASTGPDTRDAFVRDVSPRRPGHRLQHRFRIEVRDDVGRVSQGGSILVDAPLDGSRPGRPVVHGVAANALRVIAEEDDIPPPSIGWTAVRDNDCVARYVVQVANVGSRRWRSVEEIDAEDCPYDYGAFYPFGDDDHETSVGTRFVISVPKVSRGVHVVRLAAVDRAGNVSWSEPQRVTIRPTADEAECSFDHDGGSSCGW